MTSVSRVRKNVLAETFLVKDADLVRPKCFANVCWFCGIVHVKKILGKVKMLHFGIF